LGTSSLTADATEESNPNCADTYASLQLFGDNLMPDEVSRLLSLPATESAPKGSTITSPSGKQRVAPTGRWILDSREHVHSMNAEHHVQWLLDQLDKAGMVPTNLPGVSRATVCCFWVSATGNGGPQFSPDLLGRLAKYHLPLGLDIYFDVT
jgi:hypothetical protein